MPSFSVGFAQVEDRLRFVRRRLNLLTLQDALYLSGSLVALAIALVVVAALRGRATLFAVAVWAAAGAVAAAIVTAALRVRRRWLSVEQVVRFADRQAALDDRLATLLIDPPRARTSGLKNLLLEQILTAAPRWDIDTLVPRRVPRSALILAAALAALIATSFFARPPAPPQTASAMRQHPSGADADGQVLRPHAATQGADVAGHRSAGAAMDVAGLQGGHTGFAPRASSTSGNETGAAARTGVAGQGAEQPLPSQRGPHGVSSSASSAERVPDDMASQLQDAIRHALGAEGSDQTKPGEGGAGRLEDIRQADATAKRGARSERSGTDPLSSARRGTDPLNAARSDTDPLNKDASSTGDQPSSAGENAPGVGSAATAGAHPGQAAGELFGNESGARLGGIGSESLSIKLGAFTAMAPSQVEPQRQMPPAGNLPVGRADRSAAPPADEQIADAPLQKADIAPEHEALVRRIFTRDE